MRRPGRFLIAAVLAGLAALARPAAESPTPTADSAPTAAQHIDAASEHAQARIRTQRVRLERRWWAPKGACGAWGVADLHVKLRGVTIEGDGRVRLDRERYPAAHALLIDTSASILGFKEELREVASRYLQRLDPEQDRALLMLFDDDVWLGSPLGGDSEAVASALDDLRPGGSTALNDALVAAAEELGGERARGIVTLLTDGIDTGSLAERQTVREAVLREGGPAVFVVGFQVPSLSVIGPSGTTSARKFLQELARESGGAYFEAHHVSTLSAIFERVHGLIAADAVVEIVDPTPEVESGKLEIASRREACHVRLLDRNADPRRRATWGLDDLSPTEALPTDPFRGRMWVLKSKPLVVDPDCAASYSGAGARSVRDDGQRLHICVNSETMDLGGLFDTARFGPEFNGWPAAKIRSLTVPLPALAELPRDPVEALAIAADSARERRDGPIERDSRRVPESWHARPFHDQPLWAGARSFALLRPAISLAMAQRNDYRVWLTEVVGAAAEGELRRLERRLARVAPEATPELLRQVMQESPRAQELRARRTNPAARDAQGRLGAWLGDLSAAEGLARWEARVCNRFLNGELTEQDAGEFVEGWLALRELLWVPSYTRALGLLVPVYDAVEQRIGYWRIVLPRLTWMVKRKTDLSSHPDWGDLPFDLLPERPRAFEHLRGLLVRDPELGPLLRSSGWNVRDVRYATLQPFAKRDHLRAFQHFRVTIEWASADERVAFEVEIEAAKRGHHHDPVERISVRATSSGGRRATELAERLQRLGIIDM